jgi:hypothetical protein
MRRIPRLTQIFLIAGLAVATGNTSAWAAPTNDDIAGAVVIPGLPVTDRVNTTEATVVPSDPTTTCFGPTATVWYTFTAHETTRVQLDTVGSDYDTTLAVFTGTPGQLSEVTCNDDTAVAPPPLVVDISVDRRGVVTNAGRATLSGTVTCTVEGEASLGVELVQRHGRLVARGSGGGPAACGPSPTAWSLQVDSFTGVVFGPGQADATPTAFVCTATECASDQATGTVQLRRA